MDGPQTRDRRLRLQDGRAIITGAGSGIGRSVALAFAREGASLLVLVDKDAARLETVVQEVLELGAGASARTLDLGDDAQVSEFCVEVAEIRPTVLVSNAAAWCDAHFLSTTTADLARIMAVNVSSPYRIAQATARTMVSESCAGSILFTGSISALGANRGFSAYCTSKGAIVSMARSLAVELAEFGIRVNVVSPGTVDTAMPLEHVGLEALERMRQGMPAVPLGRLAEPSEIAESFVFLACSDASYISGHNLVVDAALTAQVYDAPKA